MNAFLSKDGHAVQGSTQTKFAAIEEERDETFNNMNKGTVSRRSNSSSPKAGGPVGKESQHSDFYYKLEALNEKIRLFTEVFYDTKRDNLKRKN